MLVIHDNIRQVDLVNPTYNEVFATTFCTRDSSDIVATNIMTLKWIFDRIEIAREKSFVTWESTEHNNHKLSALTPF